MLKYHIFSLILVQINPFNPITFERKNEEDALFESIAPFGMGVQATVNKL